MEMVKYFGVTQLSHCAWRICQRCRKIQSLYCRLYPAIQSQALLPLSMDRDFAYQFLFD
ncbi:hypothetical protein Bhyg_16332 [Pseudolycoriella hygida]|uniref:Uncharacterized protein n=1 Tax=Pseudolycoriella hygida TaxID=35572 RepID=A0A9Q0MM05_9DIPT|nr:hypothetical protein Bhyg_16332 [Pseudolycoriella hygida]